MPNTTGTDRNRDACLRLGGAANLLRSLFPAASRAVFHRDHNYQAVTLLLVYAPNNDLLWHQEALDDHRDAVAAAEREAHGAEPAPLIDYFTLAHLHALVERGARNNAAHLTRTRLDYPSADNDRVHFYELDIAAAAILAGATKNRAPAASITEPPASAQYHEADGEAWLAGTAQHATGTLAEHHGVDDKWPHEGPGDRLAAVVALLNQAATAGVIRLTEPATHVHIVQTPDTTTGFTRCRITVSTYGDATIIDGSSLSLSDLTADCLTGRPAVHAALELAARIASDLICTYELAAGH